MLERVIIQQIIEEDKVFYLILRNFSAFDMKLFLLIFIDIISTVTNLCLRLIR